MKKRFIAMILVLAMFAGYAPAARAEEGYDYRFATVRWYSTYSPGDILTDSCYYTDDWFLADPAEQNDALALVSMQLSAAAIDDDENGPGADFLRSLGFEEIGWNDFHNDDPEASNYTWGKKTVGTGAGECTLVAVVIQSYSLDTTIKNKAWKQNFTVNGETESSEHYAYSASAGRIIDDIMAIGGTENVKYWIMGQSRGGAVAGVLSAHMKERLDGSAGIFTYTFESPAQVEEEAAPDHETAYPFIHNYICSDDPVTMIPPWGMVRYGAEHPLKTEATDAGLEKWLQRFGSRAYEPERESDDADPEALAKKIMSTLLAQIPTRADYSAVKTDSFTDVNGGDVSVTYTYQEVFVHLMDVVFGDTFSAVDTSALTENLAGLIPAVMYLYSALTEDSDPYYWAAAQSMADFLESAGISLPLSENELYALLKLAASLMIDRDYVPASDTFTEEDLIYTIMPLITLITGVKTLTFSHQFDTLVARLKVLAGVPAPEEIDLVIPEPAAGDEAAAVLAAAEEAAVQGRDWLSVRSFWSSGDSVLQDGKVYYLNLVLSAVGHEFPDGYRMTVNGADPAEPLETSYKNGTSVIRGMWAFAIGTPRKVSVSFDTGGHGETPEPVSVDLGAKLVHVMEPETWETVSDPEGLWQFDGWYDGVGFPWSKLYATGDMTLYARWTEVIDNVEIDFTIPHAGETFAAPSVPEGAKYEISEAYVYNEEWEELTTAAPGEPLLLMIRVRPVSKGIRFVHQENEYGGADYTGTLTVNGQEAAAEYDDDGEMLTVEYAFSVLP